MWNTRLGFGLQGRSASRRDGDVVHRKLGKDVRDPETSKCANACGLWDMEAQFRATREVIQGIQLICIVLWLC